MSDIVIRPARPADASTILDLVRELAVYEREPVSRVKLTEADILRDAFGPNPIIEILLAESAGTVDGYVLFYTNWSTWEGRAGLHVEDLYVCERARGRNLGRRLLAAVAVIAESRGFARIDLSVLDWNPARAFYARLGFVEMTDWRPYRLKEDMVASLAAEARETASAAGS